MSRLEKLRGVTKVGAFSMMMKRRCDQQAGRRDSNVGSGGSNYLALCDFFKFCWFSFAVAFCFERRLMSR